MHKPQPLAVMPDLTGHLIIRGFEERYREVPAFARMTGESVDWYFNGLIKQAPEPAQLKIIPKRDHLPVLPPVPTISGASTGHLIIRGFEERYGEVPAFVEITGENVALYFNNLMKQEPERAQLKSYRKTTTCLSCQNAINGL